jgi:hypothetical protein
MSTQYTLKELVKVYEETYYKTGRASGIKAVLDFIGYKLPVDEEQEAFDAWWKTNRIAFCNEEHAFQLWKAGREELRKEVCSDQCEDTKTEPAWIPWHGTPITGPQTRYEVEFLGGERRILSQSALRWTHDNRVGDIIAYRILE